MTQLNENQKRARSLLIAPFKWLWHLLPVVLMLFFMGQFAFGIWLDIYTPADSDLCATIGISGLVFSMLSAAVWVCFDHE